MKRSAVVLVHAGFWACYFVLIGVILGAVYGSRGPVDESKFIEAFNGILFFAVISSAMSFYAFCFLVFPEYLKSKRLPRPLVYAVLISFVSATIGFGLYQGIHVTVTCETDDISVLESMGADKVIDYTKEDFTQLNDQFDFVFDAVGKSTFGKCKPIMKPNAIYISSELGPYWQNPLLALIAPFMKGKKVKFPLPFSIQRSMVYVNELIEKDKFRPLIDRRYPISEIGDAFEYVMSGKKKGNVVLTVEKLLA